ncbi:MAG: hypothetical protein IJ684_03385 [Bacteroidales bacterium]|nr:hypothetical protein [Bacteroidales bacterium]
MKQKPIYIAAAIAILATFSMNVLSCSKEKVTEDVKTDQTQEELTERSLNTNDKTNYACCMIKLSDAPDSTCHMWSYKDLVSEIDICEFVIAPYPPNDCSPLILDHAISEIDRTSDGRIILTGIRFKNIRAVDTAFNNCLQIMANKGSIYVGGIFIEPGEDETESDYMQLDYPEGYYKIVKDGDDFLIIVTEEE